MLQLSTSQKRYVLIIVARLTALKHILMSFIVYVILIHKVNTFCSDQVNKHFFLHKRVLCSHYLLKKNGSLVEISFKYWEKFRRNIFFLSDKDSFDVQEITWTPFVPIVLKNIISYKRSQKIRNIWNQSRLFSINLF